MVNNSKVSNLASVCTQPWSLLYSVLPTIRGQPGIPRSRHRRSYQVFKFVVGNHRAHLMELGL